MLGKTVHILPPQVSRACLGAVPVENCVGIMTGKCAEEACDHYATCVAQILKDTRADWNLPVPTPDA